MRNALTLTIVFAAGVAAGQLWQPARVAAQGGANVFELRTYTAPEGKLGNLHARFRDHTRRIFERHGMTSVGYWVPQDEPLSKNTLIYVLSHASRDAAKKSWDAFRQDPDWVKARTASEEKAGGSLTEKGGVVSEYLTPTNYSPLK